MFERPEDTYAVNQDAIQRILRDDASPLNRIARLIPSGATVLDIGAGNGLLGQVFKGLNKTILIDGIEPNKFAAGLGAPYYRSMFVGFSNEYLDVIRAGNYDYLVLADVIEHTINPTEFLAEISDCLSGATHLLVSLPNVAFGGQRLSLLNGSFNYVDSGLLEKTHLRFFTFDSARKLFSSIPLSCESVAFLNRSFYRVEFSRKDLKASFFHMLKLLCSDDARAYQYLFVLRKDLEINPKVYSYGVNPLIILFDAFFYRPLFKKIAIFFNGFLHRTKN